MGGHRQPKTVDRLRFWNSRHYGRGGGPSGWRFSLTVRVDGEQFTVVTVYRQP